MTLQDYLEERDQVCARDLADAERRAIIYGGSIDTALLELEVIDAAALCEALTGARALPASPPELLTQPSRQRPWDRLPEAWIDGHSAVPLALINDTLWLALHPEISDEMLAKIQLQLPDATLTITAESWIRMIADQQRQLATPPRYATLAARYLHALRDLHGEGSKHHNVTEIREAFINEGSGLVVPPDDETPPHETADAETQTANTSADSAPQEPESPEIKAETNRLHQTDKPEILAREAARDLSNETGYIRVTARGSNAASKAPPETQELSSETGVNDPATAAEEQAPIIPTLLASSGPKPASAPLPAAAPTQDPATAPELTQPTSADAPELATPQPESAAESSTMLPTLRRSQVDTTVIPDLQHPAAASAQIPSLTRDRETQENPRSPLLPMIPTLTDRPSTPTPGASAIIPTLKRPTKPTPDPDAPAKRPRRERSSGYVPATLVHRQAQVQSSLDALLESAIAAGGSDVSLLSQVQETGEQAFVQIAQLFPGPIDLPHSDLTSLPTASAHGPLLRLCIALGAPITPFVLARIDDPDANVRFYVALVFQELRAPEAIGPLARLAFDDDRDVRTIAMRVLETYHDDPSYTRAVQALRRELSSADPTRRQRAIQAMGMLRDVGSLDKLTDALSDDLETSAAALRALCTISGQHLGMSSDAWNLWLQDNRGRGRVEWMIDSLGHTNTAVRRWAYEELRRITTIDLPFDPRGDATERADDLACWRAWSANTH